ncbi:putative conidiation-specific protein [Mycena floridula]|nr:putative conidiation-specific protein [Mycena floridula]
MKSSLCYALLLAVASSAQNLGRPTLESNLDFLENPFWQYLAPTHATWDQWGKGWIPQACLDEVNRSPGKCSASQMEVYNVHYDDVTSAWVMCRCNTAATSILQMVDAFGRLPVRYRSWIRHPIVFADDSTHAYAINGEIVFFDSAYEPTLWIHESSHILDQFAIPVNGDRYSVSQAWLNTINQDPDVPDPYSNSNSIEDFAQVANIAMFDKIVPGGFGSVEPRWNQVSHQYKAVQGVMGDLLLQGGTCPRRWADSAIVPVPGSAVSKFSVTLSVSNKPTFMPKNNNTGDDAPVIVYESPKMDIVHDVHNATTVN